MTVPRCPRGASSPSPTRGGGFSSTWRIRRSGWLALVPRVVRGFGWASDMYALFVTGLTVVSTKGFLRMDRYPLAACPRFAVAGEVLARQRPWVLGTVLGVSAALLVFLASLFARGYHLS